MQVTQEEIRPQLPWQAEGEHPDRGEPHARVIVQIARLDQFMRPVIEAVDAGLSVAGIRPALSQTGFDPAAVECRGKPLAIGGPDGGAHFQPAFPVAAPEHFLNEFFGRLWRVAGEHGAQNLVLGQEAVAQVGRQGRDMHMPARTQIIIA